jgi:hypothetical protein
MEILQRLFGKNKDMSIRKRSEARTETKISKETYFVKIPQEEKDKWETERWRKDKVEKLLKTQGFHIKDHGRSGMIYFVENDKFCEIYYEISGVSQYDILIFFDSLSEWAFPQKKEMMDYEKEAIKEKFSYLASNKKNQS